MLLVFLLKSITSNTTRIKPTPTAALLLLNIKLAYRIPDKAKKTPFWNLFKSSHKLIPRPTVEPKIIVR